jgi:hypothetical protein
MVDFSSELLLLPAMGVINEQFFTQPFELLIFSRRKLARGNNRSSDPRILRKKNKFKSAYPLSLGSSLRTISMPPPRQLCGVSMKLIYVKSHIHNLVRNYFMRSQEA